MARASPIYLNVCNEFHKEVDEMRSIRIKSVAHDFDVQRYTNLVVELARHLAEQPPAVPAPKRSRPGRQGGNGA